MMEDNVFDENVDEILHNYFTKIKKLQRDVKNHNNEYEIGNSNAWEDLIEKAIELIDRIMTKEMNLRTIRMIAMRTTLLFERAKMMLFHNNEDTAIKLLLQCFDHIMFHCTNPFVVYLAMKVMNYYAYLHIGHGKYGEGVKSLELAGEIYDQYCDEKSELFFTSDDLFSPSFVMPSENRDKLVKIVTKNYEMLVYAYSKEKHDKFPECYHNVLDRLYKMPNNDQLKWSANVINLALHFLSRNRFEEARHHFSAAIHVLYEYEKELKAECQPQKNTKGLKLRWQMLNKIYSDLTIGWIKYGLHIFIESKKRILREINRDTNQSMDVIVEPNEWIDTISLQVQQQNPSEHGFSGTEVPGNIQAAYDSNVVRKLDLNFDEKLYFTTLDVSHLESQVPANFITCVMEARILFHHTHAWLRNLRFRLSIEEHPTEYMNAIFDLSKLYAMLALHEENLDSKYELTKLRVDIIETLRKIFHEFHPQVWMIAEPLIFRELTTIQLELMQLHVQRLFASDVTSSDLNYSKLNGVLETISNLQSQLHQFYIPSPNMINSSLIPCHL